MSQETDDERDMEGSDWEWDKDEESINQRRMELAERRKEIAQLSDELGSSILSTIIDAWPLEFSVTKISFPTILGGVLSVIVTIVVKVELFPYSSVNNSSTVVWPMLSQVNVDLLSSLMIVVLQLSDISSMGASPYAYTLSLCLPVNTNDTWLTKFTKKKLI